MSRRTVEYRRGTPGGRFSRRPEMRHPPSTRGALVDQSPDLPTVVRMVQSVSREIVLASLVDRVLVLALQHGGVVRGLFVLWRHGAPHVAGEATVMHGTATVRVHDDPVTPVDVSAGCELWHRSIM